MRIDHLITIALLLLGCGKLEPVGDAGQPDAAGDAATAEAAAGQDASGEPDASATCTYLAPYPDCTTIPEGPLLLLGCTSSPPTPQGGTLVDGVYQLVSADWDATADPCPTQPLKHRGMLEICGDTLTWLDVDETNAHVVIDSKIQVAGTKIQFQDFCGDQLTFAFGYTASGNDLVIFFDNQNGEHLVMHFVRQ